MKKLFSCFAAALCLTACDKAVVTSDTTSDETCSTVALSQQRRTDAAAGTLNQAIAFGRALGIYRFAAPANTRLTATLEVPDDKDYQMAFFNAAGDQVGCSANGGLGVDESMSYVTSNAAPIWVKVWTASSPSQSNFTLLVATETRVSLAEVEPNGTLATAQAIDASWSSVDGAVDYDASDADDYFSYAVAEGETFTVQVDLDGAPTNLVYVAIQDAEGTTLQQNGEDMSFNFTEVETSAGFSFTVPAGLDHIVVWMSGIPGAASYVIETQIE